MTNQALAYELLRKDLYPIQPSMRNEMSPTEKKIAGLECRIFQLQRELEDEKSANRILKKQLSAGLATRKTEIDFSDIPSAIEIQPTKYTRVLFHSIIEMVCDYYSVTFEEIKRKCRKTNVVRPRQVCMFLLQHNCTDSLSSVGELFDGRDHTTVIHSRDTIKDLIITDEDVRNSVSYLQAKINELRRIKSQPHEQLA
jgi:chromosomal replication initiation ATPase DnaA